MAESRKPDYNVFATIPQDSGRNRDDETKDRWIKMGVGWRNQDNSISCVLESMPIAWGAGYRGLFKVVVQEVRSDDDRDRGRSNNRNNDRSGGRR